jgi:hypothetical protein
MYIRYEFGEFSAALFDVVDDGTSAMMLPPVVAVAN